VNLKRNLQSIFTGIIALSVYYYYDANPYFAIAVGTFFFSLHDLLLNLGNTLCIIESMIVMATVMIGIMPIFGYKIYTEYEPIAFLWKWYMEVPYQQYYAFVNPCLLLMIVTNKLLASKYNNVNSLKLMISEIRVHPKTNYQVGLLLIFIGIMSLLLNGHAGPLNYVVYLCQFLTVVGSLYIFNSGSKSRIFIFYSTFGFFFIKSVSGGMFNELIMISISVSALILLNKKVSIYIKYTAVVVAFCSVILLQAVKPILRSRTWVNNGSMLTKYDSPIEKLLLFYNSAKFIIINRDKLLTRNNLYGIYFRFNQGMILSKVMDHIPRRTGYYNGEGYFKKTMAIIIPRLFWPNKTTAGGRDNMKDYAGYSLGKTTSMNVGYAGEAYANFGAIEGLIFIAIYITIIILIIRKFLFLSVGYPHLLLFMPLIFYSSVATETDSITVLTAVVKSSFFVYLVIKILKVFNYLPDRA